MRAAQKPPLFTLAQALDGTYFELVFLEATFPAQASVARKCSSAEHFTCMSLFRLLPTRMERARALACLVAL